MLRNFHVLGYIRYILEFFRPQTHQYFIALDISEKPFNRHVRNTIYLQAKGIEDTIAFGTSESVMEMGYEWASHSLAKHFKDVYNRISISNFQCKKPYLASSIKHFRQHLLRLESYVFIQKLRELSAGKPIDFKLCIGKRTEFIAICKAMIETRIYTDFKQLMVWKVLQVQHLRIR